MTYRILLRDDDDFYWSTQAQSLADAHEVASLKAAEVLGSLRMAPIEIGENTTDFTQLLLVGKHQSLHLLIESSEHAAQMDAFDQIVDHYWTEPVPSPEHPEQESR